MVRCRFCSSFVKRWERSRQLIDRSTQNGTESKAWWSKVEPYVYIITQMAVLKGYALLPVSASFQRIKTAMSLDTVPLKEG